MKAKALVLCQIAFARFLGYTVFVDCDVVLQSVVDALAKRPHFCIRAERAREKCCQRHQFFHVHFSVFTALRRF